MNLPTAMQIQYNITRVEEWCKSHDMPEGTLRAILKQASVDLDTFLES